MGESRIVLRRGHIGHNFYFVYSGSVFVNVQDTDSDGVQFIKTEAILGRGDSFGVSAPRVTSSSSIKALHGPTFTWWGCSGDVVVYAFDTNQLSLPIPFYSVFVSVSVYMALSTVFHSILPSTLPLSQSVLSVFFLSYCPFNYIFLLKVSFSPGIILCG